MAQELYGFGGLRESAPTVIPWLEILAVAAIASLTTPASLLPMSRKVVRLASRRGLKKGRPDTFALVATPFIISARGIAREMALPAVMKALRELKEGHIVLVYDADGREEETDMVVASEKVTPEIIRVLRKDAGGLICTTADVAIQKALGLPFLTEVFLGMAEHYPIMRELIPNDIPYDVKSAFGITINHRKTFTGITDNDRALTVKEFAGLARKALTSEDGWAKREFGRNFRAPGHIHLLNTSERILETRFGHTELATALTIMAGMVPSATVCEMMGDDGRALSKSKASDYAMKHGLSFLVGAEIIQAWREPRSG